MQTRIQMKVHDSGGNATSTSKFKPNKAIPMRRNTEAIATRMHKNIAGQTHYFADKSTKNSVSYGPFSPIASKDFFPSLTIEEEVGVTYRKRAYMHPKVRPGICFSMVGLAFLIVGLSLLIAVDANVNPNVPYLNTEAMVQSYITFFVIGGLMFVAASGFTYYNYVLIQQQLSLSKAKQVIIQRHMILREVESCNK